MKRVSAGLGTWLPFFFFRRAMEVRREEAASRQYRSGIGPSGHVEATTPVQSPKMRPIASALGPDAWADFLGPMSGLFSSGMVIVNAWSQRERPHCQPAEAGDVADLPVGQAKRCAAVREAPHRPVSFRVSVQGG
ncbi:hypothetical protein B0H66DRAFT_70761 [Apodospora peruviana]|uniref:Uncharacterized protein n=1 Tax=Apodospora peruviana TaxID=516989 RepID=A0AAE0MFJ5_9PEZI|nr:hypothetical protein B0H66DRAFT_70761 [Apodospora peruviana]